MKSYSIIASAHNHIILLIASCLLASISSCHYDFRDKLDGLENRTNRLEKLCKEYNTSIESLQQLIISLQSNILIDDVFLVAENGEQVGYTISFIGDTFPITFYYRSNKKDVGNGVDGNTPIVGIKQDLDGVWYWTLNEEWLLNGAGEGKQASGRDGITPRLTIKDNYWFVSIDNGLSWKRLWEAMGENGGSMFDEIRQDDRFVFFVLANGQTISLQKGGGPKRYGVRWSTADINDLGTRCFDALGKTAVIGVGSEDGFSDFDSIYPWSEMRRCNIRVDVNGTSIITFEDEPGFSLDGSNGDVFVRIPKFCVEKYIDEGFEYRVISRSEGIVHPAFIENGRELDEIFVGAFEGYINTGTLMSVSGVIPTSNEFAETYLCAAKAKGRGYTLYDMRTVDAIWTLYAVEYGSRNTNQYLGYGFADFLQPVKATSNYLTVKEPRFSTNTVKIPLMDRDAKRRMPVGSNITICDTKQTNILTQATITSIVDRADYTQISFDGIPITVTRDCFVGSAACTTNFCESCDGNNRLSWHTGRALFVDGYYQEVQNPMRYRWIENIIGSLWHFLPDVSFSALQMYVCDNISDYEFYKTTHPYRPVGGILPEQIDNGEKNDVLGVNHWISSLMNDSFCLANVFGKSYSKDLTSRQGFGGYYYLNSNNVCIVNGGGFDHGCRCNLLTNRAWIRPGVKWHLYGARLMYKNICFD